MKGNPGPSNIRRKNILNENIREYFEYIILYTAVIINAIFNTSINIDLILFR